MERSQFVKLTDAHICRQLSFVSFCFAVFRLSFFLAQRFFLAGIFHAGVCPLDYSPSGTGELLLVVGGVPRGGFARAIVRTRGNGVGFGRPLGENNGPLPSL